MNIFRKPNKSEHARFQGITTKEFISMFEEEKPAEIENLTIFLMRQYRGYPFTIWRELREIGLQKQEAIDAYRDAFANLIHYAREKSLDEKCDLSTFAYRPTRNGCVDSLRRKGAAKRQLPEMLDISLVNPPDRLLVPYPLYRLMRQESLSAVLDLLDQFQNNCKTIILKWGYWGYSMAEIAESEGLKSADVAKNRKCRCLKRLRQMISISPDFPTLDNE